MLDINKLAQNTGQVKELLKYRIENVKLIDDVIEANEERKRLQAKADQYRQKKNELAKQVGRAKAQSDELSIKELLKEANDLQLDLEDLEAQQNQCERRVKDMLSRIPNIPDDDVPVGIDELSNRELKKWGEIRDFDFEPRSHDEILTILNMWEPERAAKISGRGFPLLRNWGARLETALINFMLDHNVSAGAEQIWLPFAVSSAALYGTGNLPKFGEDLFKIQDSDLYLNPTAEVALTNIYREDIIDGNKLPFRFTAFSPSFRKEAGAYGRETKGLIRVHQFNKVELVTVCRPEQSDSEHQRMLETSEAILQKLGLPYRVVTLSQGDMGFSAAKTFDIEVWLPSVKSYREIASISNTRDFQARRAQIKFKSPDTKKNEFVHTLNGSALAVGRTMVALLENYQQKDGFVKIPDALVPYLKSESIPLRS